MHVHDTHGPAAGRSARTIKQLDLDGNAAPRGRAKGRVAPVAPPEPTTRDAETYAALGRRSKERVVNGGALSQIAAAKFAGGGSVDTSVAPIQAAYSPNTLLVGCYVKDGDRDPDTFVVLRRDDATKRPLVYGNGKGYRSEARAEQALVQITAADDGRPDCGDGRKNAGVVLKIGNRFFAAPVDVHRFNWTSAMEVKNSVRVSDFYLFPRMKVRLARNVPEGQTKGRSVRKFVCEGETKSRSGGNTMSEFQTFRWRMYTNHPYDAFEY